ncbi:hypothetical protein PSPO01_07889 [Paraphaeosphaeria sporulosa]
MAKRAVESDLDVLHGTSLQSSEQHFAMAPNASRRFQKRTDETRRRGALFVALLAGGDTSVSTWILTDDRHAGRLESGIALRLEVVCGCLPTTWQRLNNHAGTLVSCPCCATSNPKVMRHQSSVLALHGICCAPFAGA